MSGLSLPYMFIASVYDMMGNDDGYCSLYDDGGDDDDDEDDVLLF